MAAKIHGSLGTPADLAATTNTAPYVVPAGRKATVVVTFCNRTAADIAVRLAHIPGAIGTLANGHYKAYDTPVPAHGFLAVSMPMAASATCMGYASATGISMSVDGVEEDAQ